MFCWLLGHKPLEVKGKTVRLFNFPLVAGYHVSGRVCIRCGLVYTTVERNHVLPEEDDDNEQGCPTGEDGPEHVERPR